MLLCSAMAEGSSLPLTTAGSEIKKWMAFVSSTRVSLTKTCRNLCTRNSYATRRQSVLLTYEYEPWRRQIRPRARLPVPFV